MLYVLYQDPLSIFVSSPPQLVLKVLLEYLGIALGSNLSADGAAAWQNLAKAFVSVADARIKSGDSQ